MADKKISALTAASTPLAGTEVLPVVQGGSTVKVSVSDLTNDRDVLAANLGIGGAVNASYKITSYGAIYSTTGANYFAGSLGVGTTPVYTLDVVVGGGASNMFRVGQSGFSNGFTIVSTGSALTYQFEDGNVKLGTAGKGITLISPDGLTTKTLIINNSGVITLI